MCASSAVYLSSVFGGYTADKTPVYNSSYLRLWLSKVFRTSSVCPENTTMSLVINPEQYIHFIMHEV